RAAAHKEAETAIAEEKVKYQPKFEKLGVGLPEGTAEDKHGSSLLGGVLYIPFRVVGAIGSTLLKTLGASGQASPREMARAAKQEKAVRELEQEWFQKQAAIVEKWRQVGEEYNEIRLTPRKSVATDIQVTHFGLAWAPYWQVATQGGRVEMVPSYPRT